MKKFFVVFLTLCLMLSAFSCNKNNSTTIKIGISKIVAHPALDAVEKGIKDYLKEKNIDVKIDVQNANGDVATSASIAQKFKNENKDIVVGIATPTAQALVNTFPESSKKPIIFAAVTDPVEAGLVKSWNPNSESNVCGVSDMTPVEEQIRLLMKLTKAKTIGNIFASGESNSIVLKRMIEDACQKLGLECVFTSIANSAEAKTATQSIIDRIDALYLAPDNTVMSALPSIDEVAYAKKVPLLSADPTNTDNLHCLIGWGFDYYSIGRESGAMIEKIIKGIPAGSLGSIKLTDPKKFELHVNKDIAKEFNISLPREIVDNATVIIENGKIIKK